MTPPVIACALAVRNGANFVSAAIESVLSQSHKNFELVISDNQSSDETPAILSRFARQDRRIRVSRTERALEPAENFNRVADMCTARWIKFLCHDDLLHVDCLQELVAVIERPIAERVGLLLNSEEWLYANDIIHREESSKTAPMYYAGIDALRKTLTGRGVQLPSLTTAAVRKAAWIATGKFDTRFLHFDVFCWMRLLMSWDLVQVPTAYTVNRIHGSQVAVAARKTLRSVKDFELFFDEFLSREGRFLGLTALERALVRLKPLSVASTAIAIELMKGRPQQGVDVARAVPVSWWPLLLPLTLRNWRREAQRTRRLRKLVPVEQIYP